MYWKRWKPSGKGTTHHILLFFKLNFINNLLREFGSIMFTKHALRRCQQRSISQDLCDLVISYGEYRYDKHGARIWFLTKRTLNKLDQVLGSDVKKKIEKKKNLFVVESIDTNSVITVGYSYRSSKFIGRAH